MIRRAIDWLMLYLGWVHLSRYGRLHDRLIEFRDSALELHAAHVELMRRLNDFSPSVYGVPLDSQQMQSLADIKHAQGVSEAKAERMAQVFDLAEHRRRKETQP